MYYKEYKEVIESEKNADVKNAMMEDVMCSLFDVIGTTEQFKLTGEDSEFLQKCFEEVKKASFKEGHILGCVQGYRSCIHDHNYKAGMEETRETRSEDFEKHIMQRFMKRT